MYITLQYSHHITLFKMTLILSLQIHPNPQIYFLNQIKNTIKHFIHIHKININILTQKSYK